MKKDATFFMDSSVKEYECDLNGNMKLSYLMKAIQGIATKQLDELGITYEKMYATGVIFVLSKLAIKINRMPKKNEKYLLKTIPQKCKGVSFLRSVTMIAQNGEILMDSQSSWVIINPNERKILRPAQFKFTLPYDENAQTGVNVLETRIKPRENIKAIGVKEVKYSDLDINRHMNNTVYGDIVMDYIPYEISTNKAIDSFYIHYQNEALYGEKITVKFDEIAENSFYIGGTKDNINCFETIISFKE